MTVYLSPPTKLFRKTEESFLQWLLGILKQTIPMIHVPELKEFSTNLFFVSPALIKNIASINYISGNKEFIHRANIY